MPTEKTITGIMRMIMLGAFRIGLSIKDISRELEYRPIDVEDAIRRALKEEVTDDCV